MVKIFLVIEGYFERFIDAVISFAHAHEGGLNANTNSLVRQYFPKKSSFAAITAEEIDLVMERLNSRPRKCLG